MKYILKVTTMAWAVMLAVGMITMSAQAADYVIDTKKNHAFIQFKISHLGFSWMLGRFNDFEGTFSYDENKPSASKLQISIDVASVDTNHAERDKHLRSPDFFDVNTYPKASFVSTSFKDLGDDKAVLKGDFTLRGVTKNIAIDVTLLGAGPDFWKGYRRGFEGKTTLRLSDYQMLKAGMLTPAAEKVELFISFEGIRQ